MPRLFSCMCFVVAVLLFLHGEARVGQQIAHADQATKLGYETVPRFGGPSSVGAGLEEADEIKEPLSRLSFKIAEDPWGEL